MLFTLGMILLASIYERPFSVDCYNLAETLKTRERVILFSTRQPTETIVVFINEF